MAKVVVTGGYGFIGSNLVAELLNRGDEVIIIDNFSTGSELFLDKYLQKNSFTLKMDLLADSYIDLVPKLRGVSTIYHLAANADVRGGWSDTGRDIKQNILVSHNVAEIARTLSVEEVIFTSTGCVYGDSFVMPTPETHPFPIQTSLYGASKIAAEGIFSAYSNQGAFKSTVFRFVSVLGPNYHHGHVIDFVRQLESNPNSLKILGNGKQRKSYISVEDCVSALIHLRGENRFEVFNIGHDYFIDVLESARIITQKLGLNPKIQVDESDRGWVGDNPFTFLDNAKARKYGWKPSTNIVDAIGFTANWIKQNNWVLAKKDFRSL